MILLSTLKPCRKDNSATDVLMEMPVATAMLTYTGSFINGPFGSVTCAVHIVRDTDNKLQLLIKNLKSSWGSDLKVYLSKELQPITFINLGALKSVNGKRVYDISGMPDIMEYKYALIHCQAFNHLFGSAELKKN